MEKIKIQIIKLGESKHYDVWKFINKLKKRDNSKIFKIIGIKEISLPKSDLGWGYSDESIYNIMKHNDVADITLGIIDYPLEENYFTRRLSKISAVTTFYETDSIFKEANVSLNNYILLYLYISCTIYTQRQSDKLLFHDETRGCLFDMTGIKSEIILSATKPKLCYECETILRQQLIDTEYIDTLKRELKHVKKPLFYRIVDWVKMHPVLSIFITAFFTITLNLLSDYLYCMLLKLLEAKST